MSQTITPKQRAISALKSLFVADALAMPPNKRRFANIYFQVPKLGYFFHPLPLRKALAEYEEVCSEAAGAGVDLVSKVLFMVLMLVLMMVVMLMTMVVMMMMIQRKALLVICDKGRSQLYSNHEYMNIPSLIFNGRTTVYIYNSMLNHSF